MASVLGFHRSAIRKALWVLVLLGACQWAAAPAEAYSTLQNFAVSHGYLPLASLILDADGNLYGTTRYGGGAGTVFKLKADGTGYTILHSFTGYPDGAKPFASLILDAGGNLYGTTYERGSFGQGTVFLLPWVKGTSQDEQGEWRMNRLAGHKTNDTRIVGTNT
jgi:uncharacterized repeat protein (TIGR03803 family)